MHAQLLRLFWKTSLLCVYSSCFANGVGSWIISARVGFTAVLPCEFNNMSIRALRVRWKIDKEIVFERLGEESYEGEGYKRRADVPEDELRKGNCSLVLKNVSVTDAGNYSSYLVLSRTKRSVSPGWSLIQIVELSVHGKSVTKVLIVW
ncbi:hypothetical protein PGIGA_G00031780 [Pangasianodon gigas]|uniref:Uncharacterized protein n=1 Tax=Pangasianodon gigas TaxID=30993 RepID=A0ACC5WYT4_PANGG|nr:hypothetical protein [Pangasianodon gigas]